MDLGNLNLRLLTSAGAGEQGEAKQGQKKTGDASQEGGFQALIASLLSVARGEPKPVGESALAEGLATAQGQPQETTLKGGAVTAQALEAADAA